MTLENINNWIIPLLGIMGGVVAAIWFSFSRIKETTDLAESKKDTASEKLITLLQETADAERVKAERLIQENKDMKVAFDSQFNELKEIHQTQIVALEKQISDIRLELVAIAERANASEKSKLEYLKIIQGRNPEMQTILTDIRDFMKSLESKATANQVRNDRVDSDYVSVRNDSIANIEKLTVESKERDVQIDDATLKGEGKVLRREVK